MLFEFYEAGEGTEKELDKQYDVTLKLVEDLEFMNMLGKEEDRLRVVDTGSKDRTVEVAKQAGHGAKRKWPRQADAAVRAGLEAAGLTHLS